MHYFNTGTFLRFFEKAHVGLKLMTSDGGNVIPYAY